MGRKRLTLPVGTQDEFRRLAGVRQERLTSMWCAANPGQRPEVGCRVTDTDGWEYQRQRHNRAGQVWSRATRPWRSTNDRRKCVAAVMSCETAEEAAAELIKRGLYPAQVSRWERALRSAARPNGTATGKAGAASPAKPQARTLASHAVSKRALDLAATVEAMETELIQLREENVKLRKLATLADELRKLNLG